MYADYINMGQPWMPYCFIYMEEQFDKIKHAFC